MEFIRRRISCRESFVGVGIKQLEDPGFVGNTKRREKRAWASKIFRRERPRFALILIIRFEGEGIADTKG